MPEAPSLEHSISNNRVKFYYKQEPGSTLRRLKYKSMECVIAAHNGVVCTYILFGKRREVGNDYCYEDTC